MFDTAKVQRMLPELEQFLKTQSEIYVLAQVITPGIFSLLKRMGAKIQAFLINEPMISGINSFLGIPIKQLSEAIGSFNSKTGIIFLNTKAQPIIQNNMFIAFGNNQFNVPMFILSEDECKALYDRIILMQVLRQHAEDGIENFPPNILMHRFARGLLTFIDPNTQNIQVQFTEMKPDAEPKFDFDDVGIVIQGPLVYENNYTVQTLRQYRTLYPNVPIVVSTWQGEANEAFRSACKQFSVGLLENKVPDFAGFYHANYQIESSLQGIKYLKENTLVKFALKTRTDQRFNRPDFLLYFKNVLKAFPPCGERLSSRLLAFARLGQWVPFHISDFMMFGELDNVFNWYDIPRQKDGEEPRYLVVNRPRWNKVNKILASNENLFKVPTAPSRKLRNFNIMMDHFATPEMYISKRFYQKYIAPIDPSKLLETYWKFLHDYIVPVDGETIKFDWFKYETAWRYETLTSKFDHASWLNLYLNFKIDWV